MFYLFICSAFVFWGCNSEQEIEMLTDEAVEYSIYYYEYPVTDLGRFNTNDDRLAALQIPTNTLKKMTTNAIIQAVLDHPMMIEVFWNYQYQSRWDKYFDNACAELARRNDVGKLLLEQLKAVNPSNRGNIALEFFMSQYLGNLDVDDIRTIVEISFGDYDLRQEADFTHVTLILISRAMLAACYTPFLNVVNDNRDFQAYSGGNAAYIYNTNGWYSEYMHSNSGYRVETNIALTNHITQVIIDFGINFINEK